MPAVEKKYEHIVFDSHNRPVINGTRMKVTQLIMEKQAYGWSPEELQYQHPHLTLGQVYAALAYYADHYEELDTSIEAELKQIDHYQHTLKQSKLRDKLRSVVF